MKHGWHERVNSAGCYYQTPFNIDFILDQASNYNTALKEQENEEKAVIIKNSITSKENMSRPRMSAISKDYMPNVLNDKNGNNESKSMNEDECVKPKSACQ